MSIPGKFHFSCFVGESKSKQKNRRETSRLKGRGCSVHTRKKEGCVVHTAACEKTRSSPGLSKLN